jgi:hypothetical protein
MPRPAGRSEARLAAAPGFTAISTTPAVATTTASAPDVVTWSPSTTTPNTATRTGSVLM